MGGMCARVWVEGGRANEQTKKGRRAGDHPNPIPKRKRAAAGSRSISPHGHAGAVPEALLRLQGFVVVVPAGAEGGPQGVLVLRQPLGVIGESLGGTRRGMRAEGEARRAREPGRGERRGCKNARAP